MKDCAPSTMSCSVDESHSRFHLQLPHIPAAAISKEDSDTLDTEPFSSSDDDLDFESPPLVLETEADDSFQCPLVVVAEASDAAGTLSSVEKLDELTQQEETITSETTSSSEVIAAVAANESSRRVNFTTVEIREFPRCLGDHPSVTEGPPLTIGWKYKNRYVLDVADYEERRQQEILSASAAKITEAYSKKLAADGEKEIDTDGIFNEAVKLLQTKPRKRTPVDYNIPAARRIAILQEECSAHDAEARAAGVHCTRAEIQSRIREIQMIRRQRLHSMAMKDFEDVQLVVEGCQRKMKKLWKKVSRSSKGGDHQKKILKAACKSCSTQSQFNASIVRQPSNLKATWGNMDGLDTRSL